MGCISSRPFIEDTSRPSFHVWNIDDQGKYIKSCHIQVTDTELVLLQRSEPPIVWPLKSLRRYGFDSHLFSFECGRRCATGPGIYAFKCRKAESLFNALQECLQASQAGSEQGADSTNGAGASGVSSITNGQEVSTTSNGPLVTQARGDQVQGSTDPGFEPQPSSSGVSGGVIPTAPHETVSSPTSPLMTAHSVSHRHSGAYRSARMLRRATDFVSPKMLPRCCTIGTCINPSNRHGNANEPFRNTTCGSCRTCSLNMCVVQPDANAAADSFNRARQADYGNILDPGGHPRQCVHCCCGFKPNTQVACSADNCPLHFNNSVDQITNYDYARLDDHRKEDHPGRMGRKDKHRHYQQIPLQPVTHLYMNMDTPAKKWQSAGLSKNASWRSLPHFGRMSSLSRLAPKRSTSHFYANMVDHHYHSTVQKPTTTQPLNHEQCSKEEADSSSITKSSQQININYVTLDLEQSPDSYAEVSPLSSGSNHAEVNRTSPVVYREDSTPQGYATIDFDRTMALSNSTNSNAVEDESVRRTRHNGSMSPASAGTQTS